jgi:hypothetical protein
MAKFKLARAKGKGKSPPMPKAGLPCVVLALLGFVLVMLFLYFAMRGISPVTK